MKSRTLFPLILAGSVSAALVAFADETTRSSVVASNGQTQDEAVQRPALNKACFTDVRLDQFISLLSAQYGVTIKVLGDIGAERVSTLDRDPDLETTIDKIAKSKGWTWIHFDDGSYGIASEEWYQANVFRPFPRRIKVFKPNHLGVKELESAVRVMLTPELGRMSYDERTNKMIIVDSPEVTERIGRLIAELDVAGPRGE